MVNPGCLEARLGELACVHATLSGEQLSECLVPDNGRKLVDNFVETGIWNNATVLLRHVLEAAAVEAHRCTRGLGTSAARRAMKSNGSKTTWVVPSR